MNRIKNDIVKSFCRKSSLAHVSPAPEGSENLMQVAPFYFKLRVFDAKIKETTLAFGKKTGRSNFTRLRIIRQANRTC